MMDFHFWYTLILLCLLSLFLVLERPEVEVTLFVALALLVLGDVITIKEALAGFSNEGMLTIALLFIVAGSLHYTGITARISHSIFGSNSSSLTRKLLRIIFPVSALSAFMNNTPLVAMLIPAVRSWTERHHLAPSKFLIPISYAAILGGACTLIGTSTNLIVHGLMIDHGMVGMSLFEISLIGVPVALIGILFIVTVGQRLLPNRKQPIVELGENTREFVIELKVTPEYQNIGKSIEDAGLRHLKGLFLFQIERDGQVIAPASPKEKIREGDRLFFTGLPKTILELQKTPGLQLIKDSSFDLKNYHSADIGTYEAVVSPVSPLVGQNVRESQFRKRYGAVIIAIHRHGERINRKIGDIVLRPGDTLLLLAGRDFRDKWYHSKDFYLVSHAEEVPSRPAWQGRLALGTFIGMLGLVVANVLPLSVAALLAAVFLVLTRTITPSEARQMLDLRVLVIIAASFGIASALENSGLAQFLGQSMVHAVRGFGIPGVLAGVYFLTSAYSTMITSNATAAILFPVGMTAAAAAQADPRPFAIAVALAAALSFATPISYQTNLMVYGPGGYKFKDFLKIGLPLQLLLGIIAVILLYWLYF